MEVREAVSKPRENEELDGQHRRNLLSQLFIFEEKSVETFRFSDPITSSSRKPIGMGHLHPAKDGTPLPKTSAYDI